MPNNFTITIRHYSGLYRYPVELIESNSREEIYRLTAKNKTLIFKNNRPLLKAKNLKHWKPAWSMEGDLHNISFRDLIIEALNAALIPPSGGRK